MQPNGGLAFQAGMFPLLFLILGSYDLTACSAQWQRHICF